MVVETFGFLNLFGYGLCPYFPTGFHLFLFQRFLPRGRDLPSAVALHWYSTILAIYQRSGFQRLSREDYKLTLCRAGRGSDCWLTNVRSITYPTKLCCLHSVRIRNRLSNRRPSPTLKPSQHDHHCPFSRHCHEILHPQLQLCAPPSRQCFGYGNLFSQPGQ